MSHYIVWKSVKHTVAVASATFKGDGAFQCERECAAKGYFWYKQLIFHILQKATVK